VSAVTPDAEVRRLREWAERWKEQAETYEAAYEALLLTCQSQEAEIQRLRARLEVLR
jgi:hypothetical protein